MQKSLATEGITARTVPADAGAVPVPVPETSGSTRSGPGNPVGPGTEKAFHEYQSDPADSVHRSDRTPPA
ncbi:hypothetical protein GCM10009738_04450 [Kitasatospora viridis]